MYRRRRQHDARRPRWLVGVRTLADLAEGEHGVVARLHGQGAVVSRLRQFGLLPGTEVEVVRYAPLKDPLEVSVRGTLVSLRMNEALHVVVDDEGDR